MLGYTMFSSPSGAEESGVGLYISGPKLRTDTHCSRPQPTTQRSVEEAHPDTMKILLLAAGIAVAIGSTSPPPAEECSRPGTLDTNSLLSSLLQVSGYTDSCVAAALDYCSSPQEDGQFASLMEVSVWARIHQKS